MWKKKRGCVVYEGRRGDERSSMDWRDRICVFYFGQKAAYEI